MLADVCQYRNLEFSKEHQIPTLSDKENVQVEQVFPVGGTDKPIPEFPGIASAALRGFDRHKARNTETPLCGTEAQAGL